jgi:hypothetical protein
MTATTTYDHEMLIRLRGEGRSWAEIQEAHYPDKSPAQVSDAFHKWAKKKGFRAGDVAGPAREDNTEADRTTPDPDSCPSVTALLTADDIARITSLDDLIEFFEVDLERWEVRDFRVNKWEQHSVKKGIVPLYQVRANLIRNVARDQEVARQVLEAAVADMKAHTPTAYLGWEDRPPPGDALLVVAIQDAHLGMLAWDDEVGGSYDLQIGMEAYRAAARQLLSVHQQHDTERILFLVGNDLAHIDHLDQGKVGVTTSGTPQDFDTRLAKIFTAARRVTVDAIDQARQIAPVDVVIVSGNHDRHSMYKLGEVLQAWYRLDDRVTIHNEPRVRKYYGYGKNLLGLTHGEEFKRKREPLPLIMATEAPPELWSSTTHREWLTGHFHAAAELEYMAPRSNLSESRGVRVRSLPGLTAVDAWHHDGGYKHQRAATALVYRREGGLTALHEFHPDGEE